MAVIRDDPKVLLCDRPGDYPVRAAATAALMIPPTVFCARHDGTPVLEIIEHGQKRTSTPEAFIASLRSVAL